MKSSEVILEHELDVTVYVNESLPRFEKIGAKDEEGGPDVGEFNAAAWEARRPRRRSRTVTCARAATSTLPSRSTCDSRVRRRSRTRAVRTTTPSRGDPDADPEPEQLEFLEPSCAAGAHGGLSFCRACGWNRTWGSLPWEVDR